MRIFTAKALLMATCLLCDKQAARVVGDEFDDLMETALSDLRIRGAAMAFLHPDLSSPIVRAYGKTAASDESPDVTVNTTFMLASISKVFAGAAVGALVDQGVVNLDDSICGVLPTVFRDTTACIHPLYQDVDVTWRMIATHRSSLFSGIPSVQDEQSNFVSASYGPSGGYVPDEPAAGNPTCPLTDTQGFYRDIMIDKASETMVGRDGLHVEGGELLNWYNVADQEGGVWNETQAPGDFSEYSNFGIGYLAALVEYATNQSFEDFCQTNLFSKLGMSRTTWFRENLPEGTVQAVPVNARRRGGYVDVGHYCFIDYASGQLYSTATDLQTWSESMLRKGVPELWTEETANTHVFGCQEHDGNGELLDDTECSYALAWEYLSNDNRDVLVEYIPFLEPFANLDWTDGVMHAGAEEGAQTQILILPSAGVYAVVLTNTNENSPDAAEDLTLRMANAALSTFGANLPAMESSEADSSTPTSESTTDPANSESSAGDSRHYYQFGMSTYWWTAHAISSLVAPLF